VQLVPPALDGVADADLGDPEVMPPSELRSWLESVRSQR